MSVWKLQSSSRRRIFKTGKDQTVHPLGLESCVAPATDSSFPTIEAQAVHSRCFLEVPNNTSGRSSSKVARGPDYLGSF